MALTVYQLKVVLRDVKPAVWRRVLVPGDATIRTLHETVQVVSGILQRGAGHLRRMEVIDII